MNALMKIIGKLDPFKTLVTVALSVSVWISPFNSYVFSLLVG